MTTQALPLTLDNVSWVWTSEVPPSSPTSFAPMGSRAFRKKIRVPKGVSITGGTIITGADNLYNLYVNGKRIGNGDNWQVAGRWTFKLEEATDEVLIAVVATNTGGQAGIIVSAAFTTTSGNPLYYTTNDSWKYNLTVPDDFEKRSYDDSDWPNVVIEGNYGVQPWGKISIKDGNLW